jgi:hypothetical protein
MTATIDQHHRKAKQAIASGEASLREAADHLAQARKLGATQRESARAIGKSPAWVNRLLRWRDGGSKGSPFGPQSKVKRARERAAVQATKQPARPSAPEQVAEWQAQQARADAMALIFAPTPALPSVPSDLRQQLIAALMMLGASHPAERARARLGMSWDELVAPGAAESVADKPAARNAA